MKAMKRVYFTVADRPAHEAWVCSRDPGDGWTPDNEDGWTYQGMGGDVLYEGPDEAEAQRVRAEYLRCDAPKTGAYCYSHNPT